MAKRAKHQKSLGSGPISRNILSSARQLLRRNIVGLDAWRDIKIRAEDFDKTLLAREEFSNYDPVHGIYIYAQNQLSGLIDQLAELPMLDQLTEAYVQAQDEYMPSGPPMSPLTKSYFSGWGYFDLNAGSQRETFTTVAIELCKYLKVDTSLIRIFEIMQKSRMGIYFHEGRSDRYLFFRELITNRGIKAISPSGYHGRAGEIWFARILPAPFDHEPFDYAVVFTTPYIVGKLRDKQTFLRTTELDWLNYFDRNYNKTGFYKKEWAYEFLMKYGLSRNYWNEYIFLAYLNHQHDMIALAGFPDDLSSLPHSKEGEARFGF